MDFLEKMLASLGEDADKKEMEAGLKSYVESAINDAMPKLKENKETILKEKKTLQEQFEKFKNDTAWIAEKELTPEGFSAIIEELDALKMSSKSDPDIDSRLKDAFDRGKTNKETEIKPIVDALTQERDSFQKKMADYQGKLIDFKGGNILEDAFNKCGITANKLVRDGLKGRAKIDYNDMDDKVSVQMFDSVTNDFIPLTSWLTTFGTTDEGKEVITVNSTGGGANGGSGGTGENGGKVTNVYDGLFPQAR